ncbi:glycoside hydrolase family 28 protein [Mucilaginibacter paludis]|uniref:Glycoside hydrolase family 28 n=1 Tax=Mucilaginibacter paludis DSM 18603 TaxID=714943 RepID=H1YF41_9SPHI|nr:glycosyl hydrolase family 28 protein [Mucilaginibacter paludis]EHQ25294.1 glycoside hydrolase family 28 [Mucilaginibacter paludis DSM 18603]
MNKLFISAFLLFSTLIARSQDYVITKLGVGADSTKLNTTVIQSVIDKANASGGGTIVIPKGVYLTGALFFKPKTRLRLEEGARLKGSDNIADYPLIPSRMEGRNLDYYAALVNAYHVDNFSITGPGEINGNGLRYWKAFWDHRDSLKKLNQSSTNLEVHRPRLLFIWGCNNVTIQNVKLHNSGFWTTHLYQSNNVLIENCDIRSPFKPVPAPSTDGVDIDVCKKVTIRNCYISVNDDAVCIKGGKGPDAQKLPGNGIVEDVLVENCSFGSAHATLTLGSECIHARNITIRNCKVDNNCPILRLKMRPDTYQLFENVTVENITGTCGQILNLNPWKQFFDLGNSGEKPFGIVKNINFKNIKVKCDNFGDIEGNPADQVSNIVFKNIDATAKTPLNNKYKDVKAENVLLNGKPLIIN